ncbi:DUF2971 domain-containing protein [Vibrio parahaemolyticus]|nr:DUF2971 domain-containing protein [Vibrio parahaemolyticus]
MRRYIIWRFMHKPEISHLYKYRPFNEFTLDIIASNKIFFPKPAIFNDPYDCKIEIDKKVSLDDYIKMMRHDAARQFVPENVLEGEIAKVKKVGIVPSEFLENLSLGIDEYNNENQGMGVLSLSSDPKNILMWAHYADDHKGMCIELERTEENSLGRDDVTQPVKYLVGYPRVKAIDFITAPAGSATRKMLWSKSKDWEYEKEWRMLVTKGNETMPLPGKITSIIIGMRMPERNINIIRQLIKGTGIKLKLAEMLKNDYGIKVQKII